MEAAREDDHVRALRRLLRELHRGLGDLGAGVGVEERVDAGGGELGIGMALARALGQAGAAVVLNARNTRRLADTQAPPSEATPRRVELEIPIDKQRAAQIDDDLETMRREMRQP